jgi:hypothetical protein
MQKLLELTVDTTTVYLKGKEPTDTVLTKSAEHRACIFGMPRCSRSFMRTAYRKIGAPGPHESRIVLNFYARFREFLPGAMSLPRKGTVTD